MSFSKSFKGTAAVILAAIAAFPNEQRETDSGQPAGVIEGHAKQILAAGAEIKSALDVLPTDAQFEASIYGHANADETGTFSWTLRAAERVTPGLPDRPKVQEAAPSPAPEQAAE